MIREIKILDSGIDRYIIDPKTINLGRMYDNEADTISIIRPDAEKNSICTMIITDINGKVIDHIIMRDNTYKITNAISLNSLVQIGFSFSRADGYIKGSEIILAKHYIMILVRLRKMLILRKLYQQCQMMLLLHFK